MSDRSCQISRLVFLFAASACGGSLGFENETLPDLNEVQRAMDTAAAALPELNKGALISRREAGVVFGELERIGWQVSDEREIVSALLPAGSPLVVLLRSPRGRRFSAQVAGYKLIYDRLDRISREPGGQRLLHDLVKLPDAARYAKQTTKPGVPDLVELLPKQRSGKTRRVEDYAKPTTKIYTFAQLQKRILKSYERARRELDE